LLGRFRRSLPDPGAIQVHTKLVPDKGTLAQLTDASIDRIIDRSRRRLGVEQLDLVQFHWWDYAVAGLDRLVERLLHAQSSGKIRLLGVTNFDTPHVRGMLQDGAGIVSVQAQYSLLDRRPQRHMSALCNSHPVSLLPYGVVAGGFLSERYLGAPPPTTMNRSLQKYRLIIDEIGGWGALQKLLDVLARIAARHKTNVAAVAARWVLEQRGVAAIILGIGSTPRAQQNAALLEVELSSEDRAELDAHLSGQAIPAGDMYELERDPVGPHTRVIKTELQNADAAT
jgi:aryl-alcohol dehydrogenase-like predicted oxidoreductase